MKKTLLSIAIISLTTLSCDKEDTDKLVDNFTRELSLESAQITLTNSGGEIEEPIVLNQSVNGDYYVSGELKYIQNGQNVAKVSFGQGEENSTAELIIDGIQSNFELDKEDSYCNGVKSKYKKVIVKPLVKSNECDYVIAGIIKYYDYDTEAWVATIDYGDLTCDEWAVKTTADSSTPYTFSLDFNKDK
jgi:hypothetical protein